MKDLTEMSTNELHDLNWRIVEELRSRKRDENLDAIRDLRKGMKVTLLETHGRSDKLHGVVGMIEQVRQLECIVDFGGFGRWKVMAANLKVCK